MAKSAVLAFEDTTDPIPCRGKRGRDIPEELIHALTDSADRSIGKRMVADEVTIGELSKDLESAKRRLGWPVTVSKTRLPDGRVELWFEATGYPEDEPKPDPES